ncbi:MAG: SAM-dependent chlorinase/fluorinase [Coriobacteriia bacterium]|nr:SAM-dependent chlorinase/fluorinase [Coriobacteriia bacterium]
MQIISFVSDFGLMDPSVGVCHAVIMRACPQAHIVDLSHHVSPFDIRAGAAMAAAGVYQLPDAIHLVMVDPGGGAGGRNLCILTKTGARIVGPDNGVLLPAALRAGGIRAVFALDPAKINGRGPHATFRAHDVLAPAAAALACGVKPESLGESVDEDSLVPAPFGSYRVEDRYVLCVVLESDRFGSLHFNIPVEDISELGLGVAKISVDLGHNNLVVPFCQTYSDVPDGDPVFLSDASGWLTLAVNRGSAIDRYGVETGTSVRMKATG